MESTISLVSDLASRTRRMTSSPFNFGMFRSSTAKSGLSARIRSSASLPSELDRVSSDPSGKHKTRRFPRGDPVIVCKHKSDGFRCGFHPILPSGEVVLRGHGSQTRIRTHSGLLAISQAPPKAAVCSRMRQKSDALAPRRRLRRENRGRYLPAGVRLQGHQPRPAERERHEYKWRRSAAPHWRGIPGRTGRARF